MSNVIDKDTKEKKLGLSNFNIKVHISHSLVLLNLSALNFTKQKLTSLPVPSILDLAKTNPQSSLYQTKSKKVQYLASFSPNNQFATNVKSNNKDNNTIAIIERLFLNMGHRSSYKRLIEKVIYETCKSLCTLQGI